MFDPSLPCVFTASNYMASEESSAEVILQVRDH